MRLVYSLAAVFALTASADAQEHKWFPNTSLSGPQDHTLEAAGNPQIISKWAKPSIQKHETPGLIGGSKLFHGDGPVAYDGTFGWDYAGWRPGRVFLGWAHDRKHQSKMGNYTQDTKHLPDPVSLHPVRKLFEAKDH